MRGKDLLEGMSFIDERFVEKADSARPSRAHRIRWAALAASLCIVAAGAAAVWRMRPLPEQDSASQAGIEDQIIADTEGYPEMAEDVPGGGASQSGASHAYLYGSQNFRTNGGMEGMEYPYTCVIRSRAELEAYYEDHKAFFDLERKGTASGDTAVGFLDACDRYDEAFFQERDLILVVLEERSGSVRHELQSIQARDGGWLLTIRCIVPEVGTCDMAQWHILAEIEKGLIQEDEKIVLEFHD